MECIDSQHFSPTAKEHARYPRNLGPLIEYNGHACITGPCGDTMEFWLVVQNDRVEEATFITDGCGSSLACGSMATTMAEERSVEEAASISQKDILDALEGLPAEVEHCALLAANTLKAACRDYWDHPTGSPSQNPADRKNAGNSCHNGTCPSTHSYERKVQDPDEDHARIQARLNRIRHKVIVLSGKGGVGKSTVAVNLAVALSMADNRVGLLDIDIHGPSVPTLLGLEKASLQTCEDGILPLDLGLLKVISLGFLLQNPDDAVIWRGPMKMGVIKQFLRDVEWGDLDFLIIDSPPGTGDEPLSICQLIGKMDGAVIVTTPQKVAAVDVRKSITFCRQLRVPVLGIVENMSGFACPKCGEITPILRSGAGRQIAEDMDVPFLGSIPMDPKIAEACDEGRAFIHHYAKTPTAEILRNIIQPVAALDATITVKEKSVTVKEKQNNIIRIAIPVANGKLSMHFGHCEQFALMDVNRKEKCILSREDVQAPPHQPGLLPPWLAERGASLIIAGGMGQRAQSLFAEQGIEVVVGAPAETPVKLITDYLAGQLQTGDNVCDH